MRQHAGWRMAKVVAQSESRSSSADGELPEENPVPAFSLYWEVADGHSSP